MFVDLYPTNPFVGATLRGCMKRGNSVRPVRRGEHPQGGSGDGGGGGEGGGGGAGDGAAKPNAVDKDGNDLGYPVETPWRDMPPEQQVNYWKHNDRRKGDILEAFGGITPEQAKQWKQEAEEREREQQTPSERAIADAQAAGAADAAAQWAPQLAEAIVSQFVTDEKARPAVMAGLNPMSFVKDGVFDKDALIGHLTGLAAAFGGGGGQQQDQGGTRQWGQSGDRPPAQTASSVGLAEAERRGYIKK